MELREIVREIGSFPNLLGGDAPTVTVARHPPAAKRRSADGAETTGKRHARAAPVELADAAAEEPKVQHKSRRRGESASRRAEEPPVEEPHATEKDREMPSKPQKPRREVAEAVEREEPDVPEAVEEPPAADAAKKRARQSRSKAAIAARAAAREAAEQIEPASAAAVPASAVVEPAPRAPAPAAPQDAAIVNVVRTQLTAAMMLLDSLLK